MNSHGVLQYYTVLEIIIKYVFMAMNFLHFFFLSEIPFTLLKLLFSSIIPTTRFTYIHFIFTVANWFCPLAQTEKTKLFHTQQFMLCARCTIFIKLMISIAHIGFNVYSSVLSNHWEWWMNIRCIRIHDKNNNKLNAKTDA